MFDALVNWAISLGKDLFFWQIVNPSFKALRFRYGKFHSVLDNGFHFKIPFSDTIHEKFTEDDSMIIPSQPLTTKDGKSVTVGAMLLFKVHDVKKFLLDASNTHQTISDIMLGIVSDIVIGNEYDDLMKRNISRLISNKAKKELEKYGVTVIDTNITSMSLSKSINILNHGTEHHL